MSWFLTPNEEYKLMVCENKLVRNVFAPQEEKVAGWRNTRTTHGKDGRTHET
jgi:hypothetical protein